MKKLSPLFFIVLFVFLSFSCSNDSNEESELTNASVQQNYQQSNFELEVLELINQYRVAHNLPLLSVIEHISYIAGGHNDYMIATGKINHEGFDERKENLKAVINAIIVNENIAYGFSAPESVVNAWINSDSHRYVIEGNYTHFGLSIKTDEEGRTYFTNIFVRK